jgi:hypothetical protein
MCYRLAGMGLLATILAGLVSYIVLILFYALSTNWISPQIVSHTDDHVLTLNKELAEASSRREKLTAERVQLLTELRDNQRRRRDANQFQAEFINSIRQAMDDRRQDAENVKQVLREYAVTGPQLLDSEKQYISETKEEADKLHQAHLIDEEDFLSRKNQIDQAQLAILAMKRSTAELTQGSKLLDRQVQSYGEVLKNFRTEPASLSYDVLRAQKDYDTAALDSAGRSEMESVLQREIQALDREIGNEDEFLHSIRESPYLRAASGKLTVASMPYGNGSSVHVGSPIYGCSFGILWCRNVGKVADIFAGEIVQKHPLFNRDLRGVMVQMQLQDPRWARERVLFLDRAPLFF